ncbi:hypothetical protein D3C75_1026810 [compost metagenome]
MNWLTSGGTIRRSPCGSTICHKVRKLLSPDERAASICPLSIEVSPPRTISAIIAASNMVSATMAAVIRLILIPTSGSAKRTKKIISSSGRLRISSTR